jgi:3D (Asp-Asp-Asp) domain-containing protein
MRDLRLQAIDYKIARIRFYKTISKVVFLMALITAIALIFIRLDFVLSCQAETLNQIMDLRQEIDEVKESIDNASKVAVRRQNTANTTSIGEYTITHYCPCKSCCGKTDGITATGTVATADRTIAVDPSVIPYGAEVIIDGKTYVAEDAGGAIKGNRIDIFCESHSEAINRGKITREVFKVEY